MSSTADLDVEEEKAGRGHRQIKRKRHDDSRRAEQSLLEKQRQQRLREMKSSKQKTSKSDKKQKKSKNTSKVDKPKQLGSKELEAAIAQSKQLGTIGQNPSSVSTPLSKRTVEAIDVSAINADDVPHHSLVDDKNSSEIINTDNESGRKSLSAKPLKMPVDDALDDEDDNEEKCDNGAEESGSKKSCEERGDGGRKRSGDESDESGSSSSSDVDSHDDSDDDSDDSDDADNKRTLSQEEYMKQLRCQKGDRGTIQLFKSGFYVNKNGYDSLIMRGKSHTSIARGLLDLVFTEDAAVQCSLLGGDQRGPKGKTEVARPGLYPEAVDAIKAAAIEICQDKKLPLDTLSNLHKQMGTRLCEIRSARKTRLDLQAKLEEKKKEKAGKESKERQAGEEP